MTTQDFLFLDSSSGEYSNELLVTEGSEELTLHVEALSGSPNLTIQGMVDLQEGDWQPIAAVQFSSYAVVPSILAAGIYSVPVGGIQRIRIKNNGTAGNVKAYCRVTNGGGGR